jgi:hypothetical protein
MKIFLKKWRRWFVVSYVFTKPKSTDGERFQGVFSSRKTSRKTTKDPRFNVSP